MINWQYFPRSQRPPGFVNGLIEVITEKSDDIDSGSHELQSDSVLSILRPGLESKGYKVEKGKKQEDKIHVPVLYGPNGRLEKSFDADAIHIEHEFVVEVEAGRAVANFQFLKDLFQACMMSDVYYLGIVVRNTYKSSNDFEKVCRFIDTLYSSNRLELPLKGIVIVGY